MLFGLFSKKRLPLLKFTSELFSEARLDNVVLIGCQHLLGTTVDLFEELFAKGLKPSNVFVIGKCYSAYPTLIKRLEKEGVYVSPLSTKFDSHLSFDEQFQGYIAEFLQEVRARLTGKQLEQIILLDDGAELLLYANDFLTDYKKIVAVEQTSNGFTKLEGIKLNFPVINVARSKAKLEIESPLIAKLAERKIREYLAKASLKSPNILIVGQGYIGEALYNLLQDDHAVIRHDLISHKSDISDYLPPLKNFDVIIGATGQIILRPGDFGKLKNGAHLISVSSSDREFSAVYLRRLSQKTENCHQDFTANGITILNGGFPLNFDGGEHSLPPEQAQFTRSLLLAGTMSSIGSTKLGLVDLPEETQQRIIKKFREMLAKSIMSNS